jgi:hypothetical protein
MNGLRRNNKSKMNGGRRNNKSKMNGGRRNNKSKMNGGRRNNKSKMKGGSSLQSGVAGRRDVGGQREYVAEFRTDTQTPLPSAFLKKHEKGFESQVQQDLRHRVKAAAIPNAVDVWMDATTWKSKEVEQQIKREELNDRQRGLLNNNIIFYDYIGPSASSAVTPFPPAKTDQVRIFFTGSPLKKMPSSAEDGMPSSEIVNDGGGFAALTALQRSIGFTGTTRHLELILRKALTGVLVTYDKDKVVTSEVFNDDSY